MSIYDTMTSMSGLAGPAVAPERAVKPARKAMRVYLAGPMRGIAEFNFPAFHAAAAKLRAEGHDVFNPAERDIERHGGVDISKGNAKGCEDVATKQHGFDLRTALAEDMDFICRKADAIYMLPGWGASKGATAERATAAALGLVILGAAW